MAAALFFAMLAVYGGNSRASVMALAGIAWSLTGWGLHTVVNKPLVLLALLPLLPA